MAVDEPMPEIIISDPEVVDRMVGFGAETLRRCYQCGTCSVVCPRTPLEEDSMQRSHRLAALTLAA